jgi:hypothetical protein
MRRLNNMIGLILRVSEGTRSQIFITYPWIMFSMDNPS